MSSGEKDLLNKAKNLKIKDNNFINILLLGETGVGKSTFINSIANYLTYGNFEKAEKETLLTLIPSKYKVKDKHDEYHIIEIGSEKDKNECLDTGMSATQGVKSYVFPISNGKLNVRLIDTPGIGDVRGIDQDNINCENILSYIGQLHELHAICYLFKPTNPRITVYFNYCMTQILSRLDKSAGKNIVFIFTNTRGTDYGPGDTFPSLQKVIDDIKNNPPNVEIPLKQNVFCFDNEAFRFLAAIKKNVEFDPAIKQRNCESWKCSVEQCNKLIRYIVGDATTSPLKPHFLKSTNAINEARRLIVQLSQPLADISQLIDDNLYALQRHQENLDLDSNSLEELKQKLYMPVVDLDLITLTQPVTVCTSRTCAEIYKVGDKNKWHYKRKCHDPCYLHNIPKDMIGAPGLINCAAIDRKTKACVKCQCDFSIHMHIYYMTKTREGKEVDENVQQNINTKEKLLANARQLIMNITKKKNELEGEHRKIVRTCAKFAHFLQNNAITPFNDSYKEYIQYLILRERSLGGGSKISVIHHLEKLLQEYEEAKQSFDEALLLQKKIGETDVLITAQNIQESIQELYNLKHNGKKIKELFDCQKKSRTKEHKFTEYIHEVLSQLHEDRSTGERTDRSKDANKNKNNFYKKPQTQQKVQTQQKTQYRSKGNQRNNDQQRGRNQSRTRYNQPQHHRSRDRTPPPPYQDIQQTSHFRRQHSQSRPCPEPNCCQGSGHQSNYHSGHANMNYHTPDYPVPSQNYQGPPPPPGPRPNWSNSNCQGAPQSAAGPNCSHPIYHGPPPPPPGPRPDWSNSNYQGAPQPGIRPNCSDPNCHNCQGPPVPQPYSTSYNSNAYNPRCDERDMNGRYRQCNNNPTYPGNNLPPPLFPREPCTQQGCCQPGPQPSHNHRPHHYTDRSYDNYNRSAHGNYQNRNNNGPRPNNYNNNANNRRYEGNGGRGRGNKNQTKF